MKAIINFLEDIGGFFETLIDMFVSLFEFISMLIDGVLWLVTALPGLAGQVTALFAYCPPFIGVFLVGSLSIIILYAVLKLL